MARLELERFENPTLREEVYFTRLPSGLGVFFCPKPGFRKRYACYAAHYGSVDNHFADAGGRRIQVPDGIAHFLEHTLFETERGNVADLFAANGAYSNAATSFTTTTYLIAASDRFYDNLKLLIEFVENPAFQEDKVEKERGIIEQEIKGYEDNPDWVGYMGLLENLFQKHPIRIDIAGTAESIRQIDVAKLDASYGAFYHPRNMLLFAIGDLERDEFFSFVTAHSRPAVAPPAVAERYFPEEPARVARPESQRAMAVAVPKLLLGFKEVGVPVAGEEYIRRELASAFVLELAFGRGSDAFQELYEADLIMDDFSAAFSSGAGIGYAMIGGDTPDPQQLKERLLERCRDVCREGFGDGDFEREKRKFIGRFVRGFNSLEYVANNYTYFRFHDFDLFATIDLLSRLSREAVEARARALLDPRRSASFAVLPRS